VHAEGYEWINHSVAPSKLASHDFRVLIGAGRAQPYNCSVFNISAMSFGALSANAILALNAGASAAASPMTPRGLDLGAPPGARRRPDLGGGLGLLRLPQRRRHVLCRKFAVNARDRR